MHRYNKPIHSSSTRIRRAILLVVGVFAASLALVGIVLPAKSSDPSTQGKLRDLSHRHRASDSIPSYAIKLAGGRIDRKSTWGVWLHGDRVFGNCWSTQTTTRGIPFGETYCGYPVPPAYWRLISSGPVGQKRNPKALLFFLARQDVARIVALVNQGKGRQDKRIDMTTQTISPKQARKSHADPNFTYASVVFRGSLFCVKRVEVFDRSGSLVRNMEPVCTAPRDPIKENFE